MRSIYLHPHARSAIPDALPEELKQEASDVAVGTVKRNYSSVERIDSQWEFTYRILEIQIEGIEKGSTNSIGKLAYFRIWNKRFVGPGTPEPGDYGHRSIPDVGNRVRAYLRRAADGGQDALRPNGIQPGWGCTVQVTNNR